MYLYSLLSNYAFNQFRFALSVSFLCISCGAFLGYTSSAIQSISEDERFPPTTVAEASWIGSLGPLGALCGCLFTATVIRSLGPRRTILYFSANVFLISWLGIYFSYSMVGILVSRFFGGFATGITTSSAPLYVVGIASVKYRGRLGILPQFLMLSGIVVSYSLGSVFTWAGHALGCTILVIPAYILLTISPDTPGWLVSVHRSEAALKVLKTLDNEFEATEIYNRLSNQDSCRQTGFCGGRANFKRSTIKSILIALGIMTFQQLTGINGITFYAIIIFKHSMEDVEGLAEMANTWGPHTPAIILAIVQCIASLASTFFIDRAGRRILLLVSAASTSISSLGIGLYFYFGADDPKLFWVPLVILVAFVFGFAFGFGPVSWIIVTEILPEDVKQLVNPFVQAYTWLCVFSVTKSFPFLLPVVDMHGIFWLYSSFSLMGLVFVYFFVPETQGKSFEELRKELDGDESKCTKL